MYTFVAFISYDHYHSFVNCTKWSKFSEWGTKQCSVAGGGYYYDCWMLLLPPAEQRAAATRRRQPEQLEHAIRDIQTKWIPRTMISVFRSVWTKLELFWKCKIWNISYHPLVIQQTLGRSADWEGFQFSVRVNGPNICSISVVSKSVSWSNLKQNKGSDSA